MKKVNLNGDGVRVSKLKDENQNDQTQLAPIEKKKSSLPSSPRNSRRCFRGHQKEELGAKTASTSSAPLSPESNAWPRASRAVCGTPMLGASDSGIRGIRESGIRKLWNPPKNGIPFRRT